jgi:cation transport protein ChaC
MQQQTAVYRLAHAAGGLGSSADYLFRTCESLRESGIPDVDLEELAAKVSNEQGRTRMRFAA